MVRVIVPSDRVFTPLPIASQDGFPQVFPLRFEGVSYVVTLYVNAGADLLGTDGRALALPTDQSHLVVKVEREQDDGTRQIVFLRKVVPSVEYESDAIALRFPRQVVSRGNLNAPGDFGSRVEGEIAPRWA